MNTTKLDFKRPPVIEVALAVQFARLERLTNGHLGWFWGKHMRSEFPLTRNEGAIPSTTEPFGSQPVWTANFGIRDDDGDARLQMLSIDRSKMVQIQNGWLVVNWMKRDETDYPGYSRVKELFEQTFDALRRFVAEHDLGVVAPNLWEVTYIDHIFKDTVWSSYADIPDVFPSLLGRGAPSLETLRCEGVSANLAWSDADSKIRLRISLNTAKTSDNPVRDLLFVRSVARGLIGEGENLAGALDFGRATVVNAFMNLASQDAKRYWGGQS